jgi:hypothetical protein
MTQQEFDDFTRRIVSDIRSRFPAVTLERMPKAGEFIDESGPEPVVESRFAWIRGSTRDAHRAQMLVEHHASSGVLYLVSPQGESLLRGERIEDREDAIDAFLDLVEPGR